MRVARSCLSMFLLCSCGQPADRPDGQDDGGPGDADGDTPEPIRLIPPGEAEDYLRPYHSDARGRRLIIYYEEHTVVPVPDIIRCDITLPGPWDPERLAFDFLAVLSPLYGVDLQEQLVLDYSGCDPEYGGCGVRYHQRIEPYDVYPSSLSFHFDSTRAITLISSSISPVVDSLEQNVSSDEAFDIAYDYLVNDEGVAMPRPEAERSSRLDLVILETAFGGRDSRGGRLTWRVLIDPFSIFVDASTGGVTLFLSAIRPALGRTIYEMWDITAIVWQDDPPVDLCHLDADCAPMRDVLGHVYDYWMTSHSRDSYDADGAVFVADVDLRTGIVIPGTISYLPVMRPYEDGHCQFFFDQHLVWPDMVAHEAAHALIRHTCGLNADHSETASLEEAIADTMAIFFEHFAYDYVDWSMAENHVGNTWCGDPGWNESCPMRNLASPHNCGFDPESPESYVIDIPCPSAFDYTNDGCPAEFAELLDPSDVMYDPDTRSTHRNSVIVSHAMYLMVEGGTRNDITVAGRTIEEIEPILWMTVVVPGYRLPSDARFLHFAVGMIENCVELYGPGSPVCDTVVDALGAVGIHDRDGDRVADAYDNCIEDWNPFQENCDARDDAELGVNERWRGNACDPDPCVELETEPRPSDRILGWTGDRLVRRVGEWVDVTLRTWGGIPTATGDFRYAADVIPSNPAEIRHCECTPVDGACAEPGDCPDSGETTHWSFGSWRRPDDASSHPSPVTGLTFARPGAVGWMDNTTEVYWDWDADIVPLEADYMLWFRPQEPAEWPTSRPWPADRHNTYSRLLHASTGWIFSPAIPPEVAHGFPPQGIMALPLPMDLAPPRAGMDIDELEALLAAPFDVPSVIVATRDFQSPLLGTPYALVRTSRAATSAFVVRHQWTGSSFVSGYLPPVFVAGQLDLAGFGITVVPETEWLASAQTANDVLAIWTYGGHDRYGNLYSELWRGVLDGSGKDPVYRFARVTAAGPSARRWPMLLGDVAGQRLVLIGGYAAGGRPRDLWTFDLASHTWTKTGITLPAGLGLEDAAYLVSGSSAYMFGGLTANGGASPNLYRLDLETLELELMPRDQIDYPGARTGATLAMDRADEALYLYGGYSGSQYRNDLWVYSLESREWAQVAGDCQAGPSCPPRAQRSALVGSMSPGTVSMALGIPVVSWTSTDHEWRYIGYEQRWMTETARRNLWHDN